MPDRDDAWPDPTARLCPATPPDGRRSPPGRVVGPPSLAPSGGPSGRTGRASGSRRMLGGYRAEQSAPDGRTTMPPAAGDDQTPLPATHDGPVFLIGTLDGAGDRLADLLGRHPRLCRVPRSRL